MFDVIKKELDWGGRKLTFETLLLDTPFAVLKLNGQRIRLHGIDAPENRP